MPRQDRKRLHNSFHGELSLRSTNEREGSRTSQVDRYRNSLSIDFGLGSLQCIHGGHTQYDRSDKTATLYSCGAVRYRRKRWNSRRDHRALGTVRYMLFYNGPQRCLANRALSPLLLTVNLRCTRRADFAIRKPPSKTGITLECRVSGAVTPPSSGEVVRGKCKAEVHW